MEYNPTKDQKHIEGRIIPLLSALSIQDTDQARTDATVMARGFIFGPDPLFLSLVNPGAFEDLAGCLALSVEQAMGFIELAHTQGPGALLHEGGIPCNPSVLRERMEEHDGSYNVREFPLKWRGEILWLLLAPISECTEGDGYGSDVSMLDRFRIAVRASVAMNDMAISGLPDLVYDAAAYASKLLREATFTEDPRFGVPLTEGDTGFYAGYKLGHPVVCVKTPGPGPVFYGSDGSVTLAEAGIELDVEVSPHFGIIFPK